ncbi:MAG: YigZ family protein [Cyclobacteriaceae bacterium]
MSEFYTIEKKGIGIYKEKGSRFLSFALPVSSEQEIKQRLDELRKEYFDARHHCYAWVTGLSSQQWRANDDGEPSHSAGDPILGQIRSLELTNVLVVVVRYFGGTKLGVGGLISAYKTAAEYALIDSKRKKIFEEVNLMMRFQYDDLSAIERIISELEIRVIDRDFQQDCRITGVLKKDSVEPLRNRIKDLYNLELSIEDS